MNEEFEIAEVHSTFDLKGFLFKLLSYWPLFLVSLAIAFGIAYYINVRKLAVYQMKTMISIKDDQNPFFTSNTSLTFNWGGTTDKVNTAIITLKSRTHNEKVVERLQYYLNYKKEGKYQQIDAYKKTPFFVNIDTSKFQIIGKQLQIKFVDSTSFTFSTVFEESQNATLQNYHTKEIKSIYFEKSSFSKEYQFGEKISLPFFTGTIEANREVDVNTSIPYFISFSVFDGVVKQYISIYVRAEKDGSSILQLKLNGTNKEKLVDYLNISVQELSDNMLARKNLFATNTIRFIDSSLSKKSIELLDVEEELNLFKNENSIFNLETEGQEINNKLNNLDVRKENLNRELNYYKILENYLINRNDYREIPAPSVAGIQEGSIAASVGKIILLAEKRKTLSYTFKEDTPVFSDIDRQIDAIKNVLLENIISSKSLLNLELISINKDISKYEVEIKKLPKEQQDLLKIERRYNLSMGSYNLFLSKRSEAGLVKAANVSDVLVIDTAKDTGGGRIGPNSQLNNMIAILFGLLIPFLFVFIKEFFNTKISTIKDIERLSKIPVLGAIGKSHIEGNLIVLKKPKSSISESFRAIRFSLQFIYKKQGIEGAKTVLVTSSVSGEGKTFCSINIASVFALSQKKVIIVGMDLRKPKIFGDFDINNSIGVVNYLIHDATLEQIIQKTEIDHLDVITSGPVPPNPSELIMGDRMEELISSLKKEYDYIILDSPPIGLVSDALELSKYADATIYLVRQNYTKRGMFSFINEKYKTGEVSNISFVFNFFENKAKYGYGYGYNGYGYGYGYGNYTEGYLDDKRKPTLWKRVKRLFRKKKRN